MRRRAYYQKPSEQNRRARLRALKKAKKAEAARNKKKLKRKLL
jgi:hypothetical protein